VTCQLMLEQIWAFTQKIRTPLARPRCIVGDALHNSIVLRRQDVCKTSMLVCCRCTQLEALVEKLQVEASEARSQLNSLVRAHEQLRAETDKRVAAAKQTAAAERDVIQARHSAKVKKLQEAAKDQVSGMQLQQGGLPLSGTVGCGSSIAWLCGNLLAVTQACSACYSCQHHTVDLVLWGKTTFTKVIPLVVRTAT